MNKPRLCMTCSKLLRDKPTFACSIYPDCIPSDIAMSKVRCVYYGICHCRDQVTFITGTITMPAETWDAIYEIFGTRDKYRCDGDTS